MKAMEEAQINVPSNWIVQGDFMIWLSRNAADPVAAAAPYRDLCGGDIMAMGALCAADEMGLRVPQDISAIGHDNVRNSRFFTGVDAIHQPKICLVIWRQHLDWNSVSSAKSRDL
ncbi:substrate-binding domain-containing protein [Shigella flexneri]